jgi:hypothetical protein
MFQVIKKQTSPSRVSLTNAEAFFRLFETSPAPMMAALANERGNKSQHCDKIDETGHYIVCGFLPALMRMDGGPRQMASPGPPDTALIQSKGI